MSTDRFEIVTGFQPDGDQPQAIESLVEGLNEGLDHIVPFVTILKGSRNV